MNGQSKSKSSDTQVIMILARTSSQYTAARQLLGLTPREAYWLTRASGLKGLSNPKVYRYGDWRSVPLLQEIEEALTAVGAEVADM